MEKIKGREMQTQGQHTMVIEKETEALGVKHLHCPPSGKQSTKECSWDT